MTRTFTIRPDDPRMPRKLREVIPAIGTLHVRGDPAAFGGPSVGVVGTRRMTSYGRTVVRAFVPVWARAGLVVVSGLAYGVDAESHAATLDAGGVTVAVLASGVDPASVSPRGNAALAERISARGALVSEYPPGTLPAKFRFPQRNRVIAGLSDATVVIEAPRGSGALITAYAALDAGDEVFAVPGPVTSAASAGCNALIAKGAIPLLEAGDLLDRLGIAPPPSPPPPAASSAAQRVLAVLREGPCTADAVAALTGMPPHVVASTIAELELSGAVREDRGVLHAGI